MDVIIVGAGVAGSALAHALGKDGRQIHVIERKLTEPKRIVGELLQPGGYLKLTELGLEDCVNGIDAQRILGYNLYKGAKNLILPNPLEDYQSDVAARSFHHGRFVQKMRQKAASLPNVKLEQGTVTSLLEERGIIKGVLYKSRTGQELQACAPLTVLCDGCFSNLRKFFCHPKVDKSSNLGLVLNNCQLPQPGYALLALGNPCFMLYPISSREVRFWIDITGPNVPSVANGQLAYFLKTTVAPQIPPELYSAFLSSVDTGEMRIMPGSYMATVPYSIPGALLLGDALNMRHPITGGGMSVALYDIVLLRDILRPVKHLDDISTLNKQIEHFYRIRKPVAFTVDIMASFVQKVCTFSDEGMMEIQQALFDYVSLGSSFCRATTELVSVLNPDPLNLAILAIGTPLFQNEDVIE